jgi:predicted Zn-dependent protease with MMP-like domain
MTEFDDAIEAALDSLPPELRKEMSNVAIVVEDEPPPGEPLLGLYEGVPLTRRSSQYGGVLPDKITIYSGPLLRLSRGDPERLRAQVRHVVLHEIAHHFGISDERLLEIDRY